MRFYEKLALGAGLAVMGVTIAYRHLLSEEQRDALREAANVIRTAYEDITDSVSQGPTKAEERAAVAANRARTAAQWNAIGY